MECIEGQIDDEEVVASVLPGLIQFSKKMFEYSCVGKEENMAISPMGISIVLAMAANGAQNASEAALRELLQLPSDGEYNKGYQALFDHINRLNSDESEVRMANKIVTSDALEINEIFSSNMRDFFYSPILATDWRNKDGICQIVNDWCREETKGRISEILNCDDISEVPGLLLLNAVYLKCRWDDTFDSSNTQPANFYTSKKEKIEVSMMHQTTKYEYGEIPELDARFIDMPFTGDEISMMVFLPNALTGVDQIVKCLSVVDFCELLKTSTYEEINLALPKFKIENSISATETLKKMGLKTACDSNTADFSKISTTLPLFVEEIKQKTFFDVNEEGAEAAAVTFGKCYATFESPPPKDFIVDRPFVCVIVTRKYGIPVFMARIVNPIL